ncbi:cystatin-A-like [Dromiciops gliroides]|uniref:cystatin-A-like n=1 Tax=Dromiciops gliroides TaxID=33562 RepID=UPI001CC77290|nr:cystatin-A-like [Dromiciops gliroides]
MTDYMTILYIHVHELTHANSSSMSSFKETTAVMKVGGFSETRTATPEIQEIVDKVKPQYEKKSNEKCEQFEAVSYKSQVVSGYIYRVKVALGKERYSHLKILEAFPRRNEPFELLDFQTGKTKDDELN